MNIMKYIDLAAFAVGALGAILLAGALAITALVYAVGELAKMWSADHTFRYALIGVIVCVVWSRARWSQIKTYR
jgi:hypothetical protein